MLPEGVLDDARSPPLSFAMHLRFCRVVTSKAEAWNTEMCKSVSRWCRGLRDLSLKTCFAVLLNRCQWMSVFCDLLRYRKRWWCEWCSNVLVYYYCATEHYMCLVSIGWCQRRSEGSPQDRVTLIVAFLNLSEDPFCHRMSCFCICFLNSPVCNSWVSSWSCKLFHPRFHSAFFYHFLRLHFAPTQADQHFPHFCM